MTTFKFFSVWILIVSLVSCNDSETVNTDSELTTTGISNETLPPGQQVFSEESELTPRVSNPGMIAGPAGEDKNTSTSEPPNNPNGLDKTGFYKKKFKNLLVFHIDDSMTVNNPRLATLVLGHDGSVEDFKTEMIDGDVDSKKLKTDTSMDMGNKMKARLIPFSQGMENSFSVEPLGEDIQTFRKDRKKILWQWKVNPLKEGKHDLKLSVQILEKDGDAVILPAKNIAVTIVAKKEKFMTKVGNFFSNNVEKILTILIIPIFIAWLTTRIKVRGENKHKNQPPPPAKE